MNKQNLGQFYENGSILITPFNVLILISDVLGSGGYCDNNIGAVSSTGHGEAISKVCLARHVTGLLEQGRLLLVIIEKLLYILLFI